MKKHNFNAGPSILPREVIEKTAQAILDFNGSGLSLMEISHRAKDFQPVGIRYFSWVEEQVWSSVWFLIISLKRKLHILIQVHGQKKL